MQVNNRIFSNLSSTIRINFKLRSPTIAITTKQIYPRNFHYSTSSPRLQYSDVKLTNSRKFSRSLFSNVRPNANSSSNYLIFVRNETTSVNSHAAEGTLSQSITPSISERTLSSHNEVPPADPANIVHSNPENVIVTQQTPSILNQNNDIGENPSEILYTSSAAVERLETSEIADKIPEPPVVPETIEEFFSAATPLFEGEQSLASVGLAGWSPSGIAQQCLEFFHVSVGLPWWGAIVTGTVIVRLLLFPLVVKSQRNAAKMSNNMPQIQLLQTKMTEARQSGNALMSAKYGNDLMLFMKEKDVSPFKSMMVPLAMAPVFMSFFFGLRSMANLPVDSLKTGGLFWFADLTLSDPYYLLPLVTSVTMWITLEIGADGAKLNTTPHGALMKYFLRAMPVIMFPFTMHFPAAILCYWVSTNAMSLLQVSFLKLPAVREKFNIEALRSFPQEDMPGKKEGFVKSIKNSWTNIRITKQIEERELHDEMSFKRAGKGPIPKTYKYDPTKVKESIIQAKRK